MKRTTITAAVLAVLAIAGYIFIGTTTRAGEETGALEGRVIFNVQIPEPEKIKVVVNPDVCGAHRSSEAFIVSKENRGLKNVVIVLSGGGEEVGPVSAALDQKGCTYYPHVQVAAKGSKLTITNSDPSFHNVHAYHVQSSSKRPTLFNVAQPANSPAAKKTVTLDKTGVVEFNCDVHPWMKAYIVVHDNAHAAITDEDGHFEIDNVPAGEYTAKIWHEGLGEMEQTITISPGETSTLDLPIEDEE